MGGRDYSLLASVLEQLAQDIRSGAVEVRAANAEESNTYAIKDTPGFELNGRSGQLTVKWFRALAQARAGAGEGGDPQ